MRGEESVDPSIENDASLLYGEIASSPLKTIETMLGSQFNSLLSNSNEWGSTSQEQKCDFQSEMIHFSKNLSSALEGLASGIDLGSSKPLFDSTNANQIDLSPEIVAKMEQTLHDWCDKIESYLEVPIQDIGSSMKTKNKVGSKVDVGPKGELTYWRTKMQRLNSISEQLQSDQCRFVVNILSNDSKASGLRATSKIPALLKRWKQIDIDVTEAANEAKDNIKYLSSLQRFVGQLYDGTIKGMIESIPAVINSVKMIHTIARYYNTTDTLTKLFTKITDQIIKNCIVNISKSGSKRNVPMWEKDIDETIKELDACLKLNSLYQEQYLLTKRKLAQMKGGKQFECNEMEIFGKIDLFCRRLVKLIDLFNTIKQFSSLTSNLLEGMEPLLERFHEIQSEFRARNHDLLDYHNNKFDRDYVEFNVHITNLEGRLQHFINSSFERSSSIHHSLDLLKKFKAIIHRDTLKTDLDSKMNVIFQNYGIELEQVQQLYEKQKHDPPIARNLPPVAGNIAWSRHLLNRIEEPMKQFEKHSGVMGTKDARRIIKTYNKVAKTLIEFEFLWYKAWIQSIDQAKVGLQATLVIRHPDDDKLYVNFDLEILQLIREAKVLGRMGIDVPENAKIVLFQEEKFNKFNAELQWLLSEYDSIIADVTPVTAVILVSVFVGEAFKTHSNHYISLIIATSNRNRISMISSTRCALAW